MGKMIPLDKKALQKAIDESANKSLVESQAIAEKSKPKHNNRNGNNGNRKKAPESVFGQPQEPRVGAVVTASEGTVPGPPSVGGVGTPSVGGVGSPGSMGSPNTPPPLRNKVSAVSLSTPEGSPTSSSSAADHHNSNKDNTDMVDMVDMEYYKPIKPASDAMQSLSRPAQNETQKDRESRFGPNDIPKDPAVGVVFSDLQREKAYVNRLLKKQEYNVSILKAKESEIFASFLTKKEKLDRYVQYMVGECMHASLQWVSSSTRLGGGYVMSSCQSIHVFSFLSF